MVAIIRFNDEKRRKYIEMSKENSDCKTFILYLTSSNMSISQERHLTGTVHLLLTHIPTVCSLSMLLKFSPIRCNIVNVNGDVCQTTLADTVSVNYF